MLRGRLREADQMRVRLGVPIPLEIAYDDYTVDIPENRILAAATRRLLRLPGVPAASRAALHRIHAALADITPLIPGTRTPTVVATRLNRRYQPALRLAELVLAGHSIEQPGGPDGATAASGFLFAMNLVYEDWLTAVLRHTLPSPGRTVDAQRLLHLDLARQLPTRPDITWWEGPRCLAVIDAKYKAHNPAEDVYQLLAYCAALGLPDGHLVYVGGTPLTHTIREAGTRIHTHALDLAASRTGLLQQIGTLTAAIRTTATTAHHSR